MSTVATVQVSNSVKVEIQKPVFRRLPRGVLHKEWVTTREVLFTDRNLAEKVVFKHFGELLKQGVKTQGLTDVLSNMEYVSGIVRHGGCIEFDDTLDAHAPSTENEVVDAPIVFLPTMRVQVSGVCQSEST